MDCVRPLIAIEMQCADTPGDYYIPQAYLSLFERHGAAVVAVSPQTVEGELAAILAHCDGLVIPGGNDVDPALYGQERTDACDDPVPVRDGFEPMAVRMAYRMDLPLLGICRGLQVMNVAMGGTLVQSVETSVPHASYDRLKEPVHEVRVVPGSVLGDIAGTDSPFLVNSGHHQAIGKLGRDVVAAAVAPDGVVESAFVPGRRFFGGVQWHPEETPEEPLGAAVASAFVGACRGYVCHA